jgi:hypothetical protein
MNHDDLKHIGDVTASATGLGAWLLHNADAVSHLATGLAAIVTLVYWGIRIVFMLIDRFKN